MWPDQSETRMLLEGAAREDAEAVSRLIALYREPLRRLIDRRLDRTIGRRVDASDVVQGVLLEVSRRLPEYLRDGAMPFGPWVRKIARDHMIDAHRRHRAAARRSLDRERPLDRSADASEAQLDVRDEALTPAAAAIHRELEEHLKGAIDELEDDDREVLRMRHGLSLSNAEVARALGLSEAAAGMRHLRALRRLRSKLGPPSSEARE